MFHFIWPTWEWRNQPRCAAVPLRSHDVTVPIDDQKDNLGLKSSTMEKGVMGCHTKSEKKRKGDSSEMTSCLWWLNQPIWKIFVILWESSTILGVKLFETTS